MNFSDAGEKILECIRSKVTDYDTVLEKRRLLIPYNLRISRIFLAVFEKYTTSL